MSGQRSVSNFADLGSPRRPRYSSGSTPLRSRLCSVSWTCSHRSRCSSQPAQQLTGRIVAVRVSALWRMEWLRQFLACLSRLISIELNIYSSNAEFSVPSRLIPRTVDQLTLPVHDTSLVNGVLSDARVSSLACIGRLQECRVPVQDRLLPRPFVRNILYWAYHDEHIEEMRPIARWLPALERSAIRIGGVSSQQLVGRDHVPRLGR